MNSLKTTVVTLFLTIITFASKVVADQYLLVNATLIDPATETMTTDAWVHIADGNIVATGNSNAPAVSQRINLKGAYVLPGLVDAHLHLTAGPLQVSIKEGAPSLSMKSIDNITRFHAQAALATGVTSAFSPAGDPEANHRYSVQQRTGDLKGPKLQYAGFSFDPMPIEGGTVYPVDSEAWRAEIRRQKELGVSHIKLYHGLSEDELRQGIKLSNEAGLKTIAHLDHVSWQFAADAGVNALTHAVMPTADLLPESERAEYQALRESGSTQYFYRWFEAVDYDAEPMRKLIQTLQQKKVRVDLTLIVNEMMFFQPQLHELYPDSDWQIHPASKNWRKNLSMSVYHWTADDFQRAQAVFPKVLELLQRFHKANIPILIGSDSYGAGDWFWRELSLHQRAGLNNWDILKMVTSKAANLLKLEGVGRVRPGAKADLIVINENPIDDINALKTVHTVIQNGDRYSVNALRDELAQLSKENNVVAK